MLSPQLRVSLLIHIYFIVHCDVSLVGICCVWVGFSDCQICVLKCFKMSSVVSLVLSLDITSLRYCTDVMVVAFTCLLILIISHPVFVMFILYDLLWLWALFSIIIPWDMVLHFFSVDGIGIDL